MSNYYDVYKRRMQYRGVSSKDRAVQTGVRTFERYLATTPTQERIIFNEERITVSIQRRRISEFGEKFTQILLAPLDSNLKAGDFFNWKGNNWMLINSEELTIPTHIKGEIRECNHTFRWFSDGNLYSTSAHITSSGNISMSDNTFEDFIYAQPQSFIVAIVPSNQETQSIKRDSRFMIANKAWRTFGIDDVSAPHLRIIRLGEDIKDLAKDDLAEGIADTLVIADTSGILELNGDIYTVRGQDSIVGNQSSSYLAEINDTTSSNVVFSVSDSSLATLQGEATDNPATILANQDGNIGEFDLIATFNSSVAVAKTIKVATLWR